MLHSCPQLLAIRQGELIEFSLALHEWTGSPADLEISRTRIARVDMEVPVDLVDPSIPPMDWVVDFLAACEAAIAPPHNAIGGGRGMEAKLRGERPVDLQRLGLAVGVLLQEPHQAGALRVALGLGDRGGVDAPGIRSVVIRQDHAKRGEPVSRLAARVRQEARREARRPRHRASASHEPATRG